MFDSILDLIYNPDPTNFEMGLLLLPSVVTKENINEFIKAYKSRHYKYAVFNRYDRVTREVYKVLNTIYRDLGYYLDKEIGKIYSDEFSMWWQRFCRISSDKFELELGLTTKNDMEFNKNSIHRGGVEKPYFPNVLGTIKTYNLDIGCKTIELNHKLFDVFENVETLKITGKIYFKNIKGLETLKSLKVLDMRRLEFGGSDVYFELPSNIETLYINKTNIQNFKVGFFKQVPNLKKLYLLNSWMNKLNSERFLKELPKNCEVIHACI